MLLLWCGQRPTKKLFLSSPPTPLSKEYETDNFQFINEQGFVLHKKTKILKMEWWLLQLLSAIWKLAEITRAHIEVDL